MKTLRITVSEFPKAWKSRLPRIEFGHDESDTSISYHSPEDQPLPQSSSSQYAAWQAEDSPDKRSDNEVTKDIEWILEIAPELIEDTTVWFDDRECRVRGRLIADQEDMTGRKQQYQTKEDQNWTYEIN